MLISGPDTNSTLQIEFNGSQAPLVLMNEGPPVCKSNAKLTEILEEDDTDVFEKEIEPGQENYENYGPENESGQDNTVTQNEMGIGQENNGLEAMPIITTKKNQEVMTENEQGLPPGFPFPIYQQLDMLQIANTEQVSETETHGQNKEKNLKATPPCLSVRRSSRL